MGLHALIGIGDSGALAIDGLEVGVGNRQPVRAELGDLLGLVVPVLLTTVEALGIARTKKAETEAKPEAARERKQSLPGRTMAARFKPPIRAEVGYISDLEEVLAD